jgi:hypothetical protein
MPTPLLAILILFGMYAIFGLGAMAACYRDANRFNRLLCGFGLIYLAAFVFTTVTMITGLIENETLRVRWTPDEHAQFDTFKLYVVFAGAIFTLFYGSIGANLFTSGLIESSSAEVLAQLQQIEKKLDVVSAEVKRTYRNTWTLIWLFILLAVTIASLIWAT